MDNDGESFCNQGSLATLMPSRPAMMRMRSPPLSFIIDLILPDNYTLIIANQPQRAECSLQLIFYI